MEFKENINSDKAINREKDKIDVQELEKIKKTMQVRKGKKNYGM